MATYTIVDSSSGPLGPGEVYAGTITVNDGDVFIIDASVSENVMFEAAGGVPADFDVSFPTNVVGSFTLQVKSDLTPTITVADNATLPGVNFDLKDSDATIVNIGNGASLNNIDGSTNGTDTFTLGDNVTANDIILANGGSSLTAGDGLTLHNFDSANGNDTVSIGLNANINDVKLGGGDDSFTAGDGLNANNFDGQIGNDTITIGDSSTTGNIKGGDGDDVIRVGDDFIGASIDGENDNDTYFIGKNASVNNFNGGNDSDTVNTESAGETYQNIETFNVVCFVAGTSIKTPSGVMPVETICPGDIVETLDHGSQPVRWVGRVPVAHDSLIAAPRLRPICIKAGALGPGVPSRELRVSPQHRILLRSRIVERMFGMLEVLAPAAKLLPVPGISRAPPSGEVQYVHLLLDRHEILSANDTPSESLFLGAQALLSLDLTETAELSARGAISDQLARPCVQGGAKLERLIQRHLRNNKALCAPHTTRRIGGRADQACSSAHSQGRV